MAESQPPKDLQSDGTERLKWTQWLSIGVFSVIFGAVMSLIVIIFYSVFMHDPAKTQRGDVTLLFLLASLSFGAASAIVVARWLRGLAPSPVPEHDSANPEIRSLQRELRRLRSGHRVAVLALLASSALTILMVVGLVSFVMNNGLFARQLITRQLVVRSEDAKMEVAIFPRGMLVAQKDDSSTASAAGYSYFTHAAFGALVEGGGFMRIYDKSRKRKFEISNIKDQEKGGWMEVPDKEQSIVPEKKP